MAIKYTSISQSKASQTILKLRFFGLKIYYLAILVSDSSFLPKMFRKKENEKE
jgi:hypothetical protein